MNGKRKKEMGTCLREQLLAMREKNHIWWGRRKKNTIICVAWWGASGDGSTGF